MSLFDELKGSVLQSIKQYSKDARALAQQKEEFSEHAQKYAEKLIDLIYKQEHLVHEITHENRLERIIKVFEHHDKHKRHKEFKKIHRILMDVLEILNGSSKKSIVHILEKQKLALHDNKFSEYTSLYKNELDVLHNVLKKKTILSKVKASFSPLVFLSAVFLGMFIQSCSSVPHSALPKTESVEELVSRMGLVYNAESEIFEKFGIEVEISGGGVVEFKQLELVLKNFFESDTTLTKDLDKIFFVHDVETVSFGEKFDYGNDYGPPIGLYMDKLKNEKKAILIQNNLNPRDLKNVIYHELFHHFHMTKASNKFNRLWKRNGLEYSYDKYEEKNIRESVADFAASFVKANMDGFKYGLAEQNTHIYPDLFTKNHYQYMVRLHLLSQSDFVPSHIRQVMKDHLKKTREYIAHKEGSTKQLDRLLANYRL